MVVVVVMAVAAAAVVLLVGMVVVVMMAVVVLLVMVAVMVMVMVTGMLLEVVVKVEMAHGSDEVIGFTRPHGECRTDLGQAPRSVLQPKPSQNHHPLISRPSHPLPFLCSIHHCFLFRS